MLRTKKSNVFHTSAKKAQSEPQDPLSANSFRTHSNANCRIAREIVLVSTRCSPDRLDAEQQDEQDGKEIPRRLTIIFVNHPSITTGSVFSYSGYVWIPLLTADKQMHT